MSEEEPRVRFGQFAGLPVSNLPSQYCAWLVTRRGFAQAHPDVWPYVLERAIRYLQALRDGRIQPPPRLIDAPVSRSTDLPAHDMGPDPERSWANAMKQFKRQAGMGPDPERSWANAMKQFKPQAGIEPAPARPTVPAVPAVPAVPPAASASDEELL